LDGHDEAARRVAEQEIDKLFSQSGSVAQTLDRLNSILVFYGARPICSQFFDRYLTPQAFSSVAAFEEAVRAYQKEAVRLFSTFAEAYRQLNRGSTLDALLEPLKRRDLQRYSD